MPDIALECIHLSKKFRKGDTFDSLRDLVPAVIGRSWKRAGGAPLREQEFWALSDLSFQVGRGEALGVIGHNGAGKSTLLKILSGIMKPTVGKLMVRGKLSALIEVGAGFHPDLTGRENIFLNGVILGMSRTEIRRKFDEIVHFSGLEGFIDTPVKRYSTGMYARLGFAVAAHVDPDILLIDEVLSVGDWTYQSKCAQKMESLIKGGATVVFVSHNLRAIAGLCKRCILLEHGQAVKAGAAEEVIGSYLDSSAADADRPAKGPIVISGMTVLKNGQPDRRFTTGDKALVTVAVKSDIRCDDLAVHVYIYNSDFYNVFQTSSELLGCGSITLEPGQEKVISVELGLHLGKGLYYVGAVARSHFHGGLEQYDRRFPGATIYIDAPGNMTGPANLDPKLMGVA